MVKSLTSASSPCDKSLTQMRKDKGPKEKPCETSACINFQLEDSQLRQLFVVSYGEMSQLNQDYYQLFHSALV